MLAPSLVLAAAFALGAPGQGLQAASLGALGRSRSPDLKLHVEEPAPRGAASFGLEGAPTRGAGTDRPECSGDVCQPAVSLPGSAASYDRSAREELFFALLARTRVKPLTSMAWAVEASGLRLDWRPTVLDGPGAGARGWGSLVVRFRVRLDADNAPVVPARPR